MDNPLSKDQLDDLEHNGIVVDEDTAEIISSIRWGTSRLTLTPEIIDQLSKGKVWAHSDGEYVTLVRYGKDPFWNRQYGRKE